jgi:ubiquinone/menaquinone biosynthesis C-methylase UbiE
MIADTLGGRGSVTGVDLSEERVSACRNIVRKYKAQSCRLFRGDATSFCELPPQADDQVMRARIRFPFVSKGEGANTDAVATICRLCGRKDRSGSARGSEQNSSSRESTH